MKLLVATDAHIYRMTDGTCWTPKIYGYSFWRRYLEIFDEVRVVAREKKINTVDPKWLRVDGLNVEVYGIPFYQGPKELAKNYLKIQQTIPDAYNGCGVALFRMPSQTAYMVWKKIPTNIPSAGEIVYDPTDDVKSNHGIVLGIINRIISKQLREFCLKVNGVSYVTEYSIQNHYPSIARIKGSSDYYFESHYSTITLSERSFLTNARSFDNNTEFKLIISSVAMNSERKGERIFINAIRKLRDYGYNASGVIIGDGTMRHSFEQYAEELQLTDYVEFTGLLASADEVREYLLKSDIFVFPTQAEGLPRGVLEAMASALPVVTTPVGGIPEVIEPQYLVRPDDVEGFVNCIRRLIDNRDEMNRVSKRNLEKSREFSNTILQDRRNLFYKQLRKLVVEKNYSDE